MSYDEPTLQRIAFAGNALAPFFLEDPVTGNASTAFAAFGRIQPEEAAREWPFADTGIAALSLDAMVRGLAPSMTPGGFAADEGLAGEYRRLFIGPGPLPAPPWGSVYTDRDNVIFGAATLALRDWMRGHGVARLDAGGTPEDHIGLELGLMAWLAQNQPGDLREFLSFHLLTWSGHFLEGLRREARHPFYAGLGELAAATLEGMRLTLALEVEYPRFYR